MAVHFAMRRYASAAVAIIRVCFAIYHIRDLCQNGIANHHATYARYHST